MKCFLVLAAAVAARVACGGVDVSGTINIHVDADVLTAFVSVVGGVAALVNGMRPRKSR